MQKTFFQQKYAAAKMLQSKQILSLFHGIWTTISWPNLH